MDIRNVCGNSGTSGQRVPAPIACSPQVTYVPATLVGRPRKLPVDHRRSPCHFYAAPIVSLSAKPVLHPSVRQLLLPALGIAAFLAASTPAVAQQPTFHGRKGQTTATIPRLDATAVIDGVIDDAPWKEAALLTGFSAYLPIDGQAAHDSTEVYVWYSQTDIYVAARAFETHGPVHATLAARDKIDMDDHIQILIDPFNDRRRAFVFDVNPLGVQADGVRTEGFSPPQARGQTFGSNPPAFIDLSADLVFESKARLTETGYEIEMRIPMKSIRFQGNNEQTWAFQVVRFVQHSGYQQTWTQARRGAASFLVQSGTMKGIRDVKRDQVIELNPELTESLNGAAGTRGWAYDSKPNLGGNIRWRVIPNLTINATARPDFSQVEADAAQVAGDTRFALFFPERRPFFIDGSEQFDAPNNLIYTRRIQQPDAAVKASGRFGKTSVAYLGALDDQLASSSGRDRPVFNILRLRQDILGASTLGLSLTDRTEGEAFSRVAVMDTRVIFRKAYSFNFTGGGSSRRTAANAPIENAPFWDLGINRTGLRYGLRYTFTGRSEAFEAASGFVPRSDFVNATAFNRFSWFGKPGDLIESYLIRQGAEWLFLYDGFQNRSRVQETKYQAENVFNLRGGWVVSITPVVEQFRFDARQYANYRVRSTAGPTSGSPAADLPFVTGPRTTTAVVLLRVQTPQYERWTGRFTSFAGRDIEFFETTSARRFDVTAEVDVRPTDQIRVNASYLFSQYTRQDETTLSRANVPRLRLEYQINRALFLRFVGQYDNRWRDALRDPTTGFPIAIDDNGTAVQSVRSDTRDLRVDWLINFVPSPGTVVFFGYGSSLTEPDAFRFRALERVRDGFFLKLSYLLRR